MDAKQSDKPWLLGPGDAVDCNGVPIYPGDLLRTPHFRDRRRRLHYLYHVAVQETVGKHVALRMVPTQHLEPTLVSGGGACLLSPEMAAAAEVIDGHGPGKVLDFRDRKKAVKKWAGGEEQ
jgi:hypothetical protein